MQDTDREDDEARRHGPMARWIKILDMFLERDEWGVRELGLASGLPRSAVHRILHEMERLGLLAPGGARGQFRVGPELARIAVILAGRLDVTTIGRSVLEAARQQTGETVILALYSSARRQFWAVDAAESDHPIRYIWGSLRTWSDLHVGASGKGILAFLPEAEQEAILARLPEPIPGLRPVSKGRLREELSEARRRGYVVSHGERFEGAVGISAPIRDAAGRVIGDLIASWPDNRTSPQKEELGAAAIVASARDLSERLGFRGDPPDEALA